MKEMKNVVFLYAGFPLVHAFDVLFASQTAFDRVLDWALSIQDCAEIVIATTASHEGAVQKAIAAHNAAQCRVLSQPSWNTASMLDCMAQSAAAQQADFVLYTLADRPFLDKELTDQLMVNHITYLSEYTFADGYPSGFAPELISTGTLSILASLAKGSQKAAGDAPVGNESVFNVLRGDINSFEVETVIAPKDYRMLRFDFSCSTKLKTNACKALYDEAVKSGCVFEAQALSDLALASAAVQQTVPAFYNIQIAENCSTLTTYNPYPEAFKAKRGVLPLKKDNPEPHNMDFDQFRVLIDCITLYSETAVVGLSAFSEPLTNEAITDFVACVLKRPGLSVLIETDGTLVTPALAQKIAGIAGEAPERTNGMLPVIWIVGIDAMTEECYAKIHTNTLADVRSSRSFQTATDAVKVLESYFPDAVYPQFVRMKDNEAELERFYRFYHDKESPSKGRLIIQKYDSYCGLLTEQKTADLAPLERNPCWHLKRDMFVLCDGSVPLCREHVLDGIVGNAFSDGIDKVWDSLRPELEKQIRKDYGEKCKDCDEYYTFNF